jgi:hypothetical protein
MEIDGRNVAVCFAVPGAEGRYEDWVYLRLIEQEWKRPEHLPTPSLLDHRERLSPRASIAILFWSYFETRIERLLRACLCNVPPRLADDTLQRYSGIGIRIDRLYRILFETTYWDDLRDLEHGAVADLLRDVQQFRNEFAHGNPISITDDLVKAVVEKLKDEHESWIAVFNRRATRKNGLRDRIGQCLMAERLPSTASLIQNLCNAIMTQTQED